MRWTEEQKAIFENENADKKIEAVAGSGKTTTLIEYAERHKDKNILYLAFNRSVAREVSAKAPLNLVVLTAHSLAFRGMFAGKKPSLKPLTSRLIENYLLFKVRGITLKVGIKRVLFFELIKKIVDNWFYSDYFSFRDFFENWIKDNNQYLKAVVEKDKISPKGVTELLYDSALKIIKLLSSGEVPIPHDFYLKEFQLKKPKLNYDVIMLDEAQDSNPAMLSIILNQDAQKIIVGDPHQQIYAWRGAVNSMDRVNFPTFRLSKSFRFGEEVALLSEVLIKKYKEIDNFEVKGVGGGKKEGLKNLIVARSNAGLLVRSLNLADRGEKFRIEGGISALMTLDDPKVSLKDIILFKETGRTTNYFLSAFKDWIELIEFAKENSEVYPTLYGFVKLVNEFGNRILVYLEEIEAMQKEIDEEVDEYDIVLSTVHKAKGLEFNEVTLINDFPDIGSKNLKDRVEVINLLYVAITRSRTTVRGGGRLLERLKEEAQKLKTEKQAKMEYIPTTNRKIII